MIVFIEQDRHGLVTRHGPGLLRHGGDAGGMPNAVGMKQKEVGTAHDAFLGDGAATVTGADQETTAALLGFADPVDKFVNTTGFEDLVVVGFDVGLVIDLDEDITPAALKEPAGGFFGGADDGGFVLETLILAKVEVTQDDDHAVCVSGIEHTLHARGEGRPETAIGLEGVVDPRLGLRVALRRATLKVHGDGEQAVRFPFRQGGDEFTDVPFGVPFARVGVSPTRRGLGIEIIVSRLYHA